jgi:hypothetical protein
VYDGWRKALAPADLVLSLLAKRAYPFYRFWYEFGKRTEPLFSPAARRVSEAQQGLLFDLQWLGFAMRPSGATRAEVSSAREYVFSLAERARARAGKLDPAGTTDIVRFAEDDIQYEVFRTGRRLRFHFSPASLSRSDVPKLVREHAALEWAAELVQGYLGTSRVVAGKPYYMAEIVESGAPVEPWHIDCVRPTVKVFLTLNDVNAENAPLRYVGGTHRVDENRHRLFYDICRGGLGAAYFEQPVCDELDKRGTSVIAPEGTFIVFDNRGVHAGSYCQSGQRVLLANGYRPATTTRLNPRLFRDPHPVPYPWERAK